MTTISADLHGFDYRLWMILTLQMLIPTVWLTIRIYFIGDMPESSGIDIASQLMWISLLYEIFQEALVVPLYYVFGKCINDREAMSDRIRGGIAVIAVIYLIFAAVILLFADPLVAAMGQDPSLALATAQYVRLETIASLFSMMVRLLIIAMVSMHEDTLLYLVLLIQMVLTVLTDTLLISSLQISLDLGVNGIAYSNMIVNIAVLALCITLLHRRGLRIVSRTKPDTSWMREWARVGMYSGAESFLRNLVFMVMVVRMVNLVSSQGDYWIANNFIWNWLLIPFLSLGDVAKKQISESPDNISSKTRGYVAFTVVLLVIMYVSIPAWPWFLENAMNASDADTVFTICLWMLIPYTTYVFNNIMDSTFTALGRTDCLLIQSICIDGVYYGCVFLLYCLGVFVPSLPGIVAMFGIGMMLDLLPASLLYRRVLRENNQTVSPRFSCPHSRSL